MPDTESRPTLHISLKSPLDTARSVAYYDATPKLRL